MRAGLYQTKNGLLVVAVEEVDDLGGDFLMRHFDDKEQEERPGVLGVRGTGWFLSPTSIVTVEHVAAAMKLSEQDWKQVEIGTGESRQSVPVRIQRLAGYGEKIAVLELQTAFSGAQGFRLRMEPLAPEEPVVSLAYPGGRLRVVGGRFVQYGDGDKLAGTALLEMYDGNDRLVLDHGSSGALIARAEWSRWSATCSQRPYGSCRRRDGSRPPGAVPTSFPCPSRCSRNCPASTDAGGAAGARPVRRSRCATTVGTSTADLNFLLVS